MSITFSTTVHPTCKENSNEVKGKKYQSTCKHMNLSLIRVDLANTGTFSVVKLLGKHAVSSEEFLFSVFEFSSNSLIFIDVVLS